MRVVRESNESHQLVADIEANTDIQIARRGGCVTLNALDLRYRNLQSDGVEIWRPHGVGRWVRFHIMSSVRLSASES